MSTDPTQNRRDTRTERLSPPQSPKAARVSFGCLLVALAILLCPVLAYVALVAVQKPLDPHWVAIIEERKERYHLAVDGKNPQLEQATQAAAKARAVAEAYRGANDMPAYRRWKAVADRHMRAAVPGMR